jgi:hypothetical protein
MINMGPSIAAPQVAAFASAAAGGVPPQVGSPMMIALNVAKSAGAPSER